MMSVEEFCAKLKAFCLENGFEIAGTFINSGQYGEITVLRLGDDPCPGNELGWEAWNENKWNFAYQSGDPVELPTERKPITAKDIAEAKWFPAGPDCEGTEIGDLRFFKHREGHCSVSWAKGAYWTARFESFEAALSWANDPDGAEAKFKEINPGSGFRDNMVGMRKSDEG